MVFFPYIKNVFVRGLLCLEGEKRTEYTAEHSGRCLPLKEHVYYGVSCNGTLWGIVMNSLGHNNVHC